MILGIFILVVGFPAAIFYGVRKLKYEKHRSEVIYIANNLAKIDWKYAEDYLAKNLPAR